MFTSPCMTPNKYALAFRSLQSLVALEPETYDDLEVRYPITNPLSHAAALLLGIWGMVSAAGPLTNIKTSCCRSHGRNICMWIYPLTPVLNIWPQKNTLLVFRTQCLKGNAYRLLYLLRWNSCVTKFHSTTSGHKGFALHKISHFAHLRVFFCQHTDNLCKIRSSETKFSFYLVKRAQNTTGLFCYVNRFEIKSLKSAMVCWFWLGQSLSS